MIEIKGLYIKGLRENPNVSLQLWDENYIVDSNMSAEENAEMVKFHNDKCKEKVAEYNKKKALLNKQIRKEILKFIICEYGFSEEKARYIEQWVQTETRDKTRQDYFDKIELICDFIAGLPKL